MTIYKKTGELVLGTRFKRLSDKFLGDVSKVYKSLDIPFEPAWFPVFYLLNEKGELTVTELAGELEITHSGSSQMVNSLEKKGLLSYRQSMKDKRVRSVLLTPKGTELLKKVRPVWISIKSAMEDILEEGSRTPELLMSLGELETAMQKKSLCDRVVERFKVDGFPVPLAYSHYESHNDQIFRSVILEWLSVNHTTSGLIKDIVNNPAEFTSKKGNNIIIASSEERGKGVIITSFLNETDCNIQLLFSKNGDSEEEIEKGLVKEAVEALDKHGFTNLGISLGKGNEKRTAWLKELGFVLQNISSDSKDNFYINLNMNLKGGKK